MRVLHMLFPRLDFEPGEEVEWRALANRRQGQNRAVGGRLIATNRRLLFQPHRLDSRFGGEAWSADISVVTEIGVGPRVFAEGFSGGHRKRLSISTPEGTELFVVWRLASKVNELRKVLDLADPPDSG